MTKLWIDSGTYKLGIPSTSPERDRYVHDEQLCNNCLGSGRMPLAFDRYPTGIRIMIDDSKACNQCLGSGMRVCKKPGCPNVVRPHAMGLCQECYDEIGGE